MPVPEGYTKLGIIGFVDKGEYLNDATYMSGDVVFYNGSTYKVIKDNLSGVTPSNDGKNYRYMAQGFSATEASGVTAIDTQDLTGVGKGKKSTVQALLDKIAQKLVERVVTSDTFQTVLGKYLVNNGLTTEAGKFGLDAAFGKNLQDQITQQNSNLGDTGSRLESLSSDLNTVKTNVDPVKSSYIDNADTNILNRINLVVWDPDTASTPYKTGNTVYGNGFCITYSTGDQWLCQFAMAVGDSNLFTRHRRLGVWSGWTTIGTATK